MILNEYPSMSLGYYYVEFMGHYLCVYEYKVSNGISRQI